jgi:hypothetical protein
MCDLRLTSDSCPALQPLPSIDTPRSLKQIYEQPMPSIPLTANSTLDFSPRDFQAFATQERKGEFVQLYEKYCSKYKSGIFMPDFERALFCLVGLMNADLVPFLLEGQNDPKFYHQGITPLLPPKLLVPRRTAGDWTVDCFVARFGKFENTFSGGYERWPSPIAWLEAEMKYEVCQGQDVRPCKLIFVKGEKEPKDPPVIAWERLQGLKWQTRGNHSQYPKPLIPKVMFPFFFLSNTQQIEVIK